MATSPATFSEAFPANTTFVIPSVVTLTLTSPQTFLNANVPFVECATARWWNAPPSSAGCSAGTVVEITPPARVAEASYGNTAHTSEASAEAETGESIVRAPT